VLQKCPCRKFKSWYKARHTIGLIDLKFAVNQVYKFSNENRQQRLKCVAEGIKEGLLFHCSLKMGTFAPPKTGK
jgi:hypothetical protein